METETKQRKVYQREVLDQASTPEAIRNIFVEEFGEKEYIRFISEQEMINFLVTGEDITEAEEFEFLSRKEEEERPKGKTLQEEAINKINKKYFSHKDAVEIREKLARSYHYSGAESVMGFLSTAQWRKVAKSLDRDIGKAESELHIVERLIKR